MSIAEKFEVIADEVFEKGKQTQSDEFWTDYMKNINEGGAANYIFAGSCWNSRTFYPKYDIRPKATSANGMFTYFSWEQTPRIDLAQRLKDCGVVLDFSQFAGSTAQMFSNCYVTRLPKLDFSRVKSTHDRTFRNMAYLVTIDELVLNDSAVSFSNTFQNCGALANIIISGIINRSISFADSPKLTSASIDSIIDALKKLEEGEAAQTLTLHSTVKENMTDAQIAAIAEKGWTLA